MRFHMIEGGPRPVAPFSHAVEDDGWVFVTGQMPDTPSAPGVLPAGIEAQTTARARISEAPAELAALDPGDLERLVGILEQVEPPPLGG